MTQATTASHNSKTCTNAPPTADAKTDGRAKGGGNNLRAVFVDDIRSFVVVVVVVVAAAAGLEPGTGRVVRGFRHRVAASTGFERWSRRGRGGVVE